MSTTYDIAAFDGLELGISVTALLRQNAQLSSADLISGIAKLAQRFLLTLLTEQGSVTYDSMAGCTFLADMRAGRWRTSADVLQSFNYSLLDIQRQLTGVELPTDTADEKYGGVTVTSISLTADKAVLVLLLTSQAGTQQVLAAAVRVVVS